MWKIDANLQQMIKTTKRLAITAMDKLDKTSPSGYASSLGL